MFQSRFGVFVVTPSVELPEKTKVNASVTIKEWPTRRRVPPVSAPREAVGAGTVGPSAPRRKAGLTTGVKGITRVRYGLSWDLANVIYGCRRPTEDVSNQTLLVQKRGETLTPLSPRKGTITRVGSRNIRARSRWERIAWYRDSAIPGLTCTTRCNAVLRETESYSPEIVSQINVIELEAERAVRRIRSDTSTPEASARRTEDWHLGWVQWSIS